MDISEVAYKVQISQPSIAAACLQSVGSAHSEGDPSRFHDALYMKRNGFFPFVPGMQLHLLAKHYTDVNMAGKVLHESHVLFGEPVLLTDNPGPTIFSFTLKPEDPQNPVARDVGFSVQSPDDREAIPSESSLRYNKPELLPSVSWNKGIEYTLKANAHDAIRSSTSPEGNHDLNTPLALVVAMASNVIYKSLINENPSLSDQSKKSLAGLAGILDLTDDPLNSARGRLPVYLEHHLRVYQGALGLSIPSLVYLDLQHNYSDVKADSLGIHDIDISATNGNAEKIYDLHIALKPMAMRAIRMGLKDRLAKLKTA